VLQLCSAIRSLTACPLVLVGAQCSERATITAFTTGVDSVLTLPIGPHEFIARLRALLRRMPAQVGDDGDVLIVGPVRLDRNRRELTVDGQLVALPRREFDIAELLMREAGLVVPRTAIVRELWGSMRDTKSLDVQVGRLRARLAQVEGGRRIITVRGVGYRFLTELLELDVSTIDLVGEELDEAHA
jgi:two-component system response regulator RegX3